MYNVVVLTGCLIGDISDDTRASYVFVIHSDTYCNIRVSVNQKMPEVWSSCTGGHVISINFWVLAPKGLTFMLGSEFLSEFGNCGLCVSKSLPNLLVGGFALLDPLSFLFFDHRFQVFCSFFALVQSFFKRGLQSIEIWICLRSDGRKDLFKFIFKGQKSAVDSFSFLDYEIAGVGYAAFDVFESGVKGHSNWGKLGSYIGKSKNQYTYFYGLFFFKFI